MNNRILELMKQADYPAPEIALRAQKLAELVVRECAEIVRKRNYESIRNDEHYNINSSELLEHFGVKE